MGSLRIAVALLLLISVQAVAGVSGWTDYGSVVELTPTSHGRYLVKLNVSDNASGCRNKTTFYQDYNIPGAREMFATLLEATVTGKSVRVFVTGVCELNGYSEISSVSIVP